MATLVELRIEGIWDDIDRLRGMDITLSDRIDELLERVKRLESRNSA